MGSTPGGVLAWQPSDHQLEISVIDSTTGSIAAAYQAHGSTVDDHIFVATIDPSRSSIYYAGFGIGRVDMITGTETTIVDGSSEENLTRVSLMWSPSGDTLVSGLCGQDRCESYDFVDTKTLTATRWSGPIQIHAITDEYVVGRDLTEGHPAGWMLIETATGQGRRVAEKWISRPTLAFASDDDRFVVAGQDDSGTLHSVVSIDPVTGAEILVYQGAWHELTALEVRPESYLSSRWVALVPGPFSKALFEGRTLDLPLIDVERGQLDTRTASAVVPSP